MTTNNQLPLEEEEEFTENLENSTEDNPSSGTSDATQEEKKKGRPPSPTLTQLIGIIDNFCGDPESDQKTGYHKHLFLSKVGKPYAWIAIGDRRGELFLIETGSSAPFRMWLQRLYYKAYGRMPPQTPLNEAVAYAMAEAFANPEKKSINRRIASDGNNGIYIDIGNHARKVYHITGEGWAIEEAPENVYFIRDQGMESLPIIKNPTIGDINLLHKHLNVQDEYDFRLAVAYIIGAFKPGNYGQEYVTDEEEDEDSILPLGSFPVLAIQGPPGSAKTTATRILMFLIDPHIGRTINVPKNSADMALIASTRHLIPFENVNSLSHDMQAILCCMSTSAADQRRSLYTNDSIMTTVYSNPVIVNGIGETIITTPDLLDRTVVMSLREIGQVENPEKDEQKRRIAELKVYKRLAPDRRGIFCAILDALVFACRNFETIMESDIDMPRMADFFCWNVAACEGLPWSAEDFTTAYTENRNENQRTLIENDFFSSSLASYVKAIFAGPKVLFENLTPKDLEIRSASEIHIKPNIFYEQFIIYAQHRAEQTGQMDAYRSRNFPKQLNGIAKKVHQVAPSLYNVYKVSVAVEKHSGRWLGLGYKGEE